MSSISVNDLQPRERIAALTGVMIAFLAPSYLSATKLGLTLVEPSSPVATLINELAIWLVALAILGIVLFWERASLKSIGFVPLTWDAALLGLLCVAPLLVLSMATGASLRAFGAPANETEQAAMILTLPLWLQAFVALTAGFTEEILFRGYAIERVTQITGSKWLGALVPPLLFGAAHAPFWGLPHAIVAASTGFWLTLLYLWRRNLWVNIIAHALLDGILFAALDIKAVLPN